MARTLPTFRTLGKIPWLRHRIYKVDKVHESCDLHALKILHESPSDPEGASALSSSIIFETSDSVHLKK
jgi:hypothetical protein